MMLVRLRMSAVSFSAVCRAWAVPVRRRAGAGVDFTDGSCVSGGNGAGPALPPIGRYRMLLSRPAITFWLVASTCCMVSR